MDENKTIDLRPRRRALFFLLDCLSWNEARLITYNLNYGFIEGLEANGIDCLVVPIFGDLQSESKSSWAYHLREVLEDRTSFDMVFVLLPHSKFETKYWEWITSLATVRVGILMESIRYDPIFSDAIELLKNRAELVESQLPFCTHVLVSDSRDVEEINRRNLCKAYWYPPAVLARQVADQVPIPLNKQGAFFGTPYYHRNNFLQDDELRKYMTKPNPPEDLSGFPEKFNSLNSALVRYLSAEESKDLKNMEAFVKMQGQNRKEMDSLWMAELKKWSVQVNLPSLFNGYASRVVESMAAGRPVVSWRIADSVARESLFVDGEEILLFDKNEPKQLARHLELLISDENLAAKIAEKALVKVRSHHTIEGRIKQLMNVIYSAHELNFR